MRILHLIPSISASDGGPVEALAAWCDGLVRLGVSITVAYMMDEDDQPSIALNPGIDHIEDRKCLPYIRYGTQLEFKLKKTSFDLIHSHGLWTYPNYLAAKIARERTVPHVISCCGMLDPRALNRSSYKKKIAALAFQNTALTRASMLIANSDQEVGHIHKFIRHDRIALIANPVRSRPSLPSIDDGKKVNILCLPDEANVLLFLGRLHPVKGVSRLLEAWNVICQNHSNWHLVLAGPDQGQYQDIISSFSAQFHSRIHLTGQVDRLVKWELFDRADLFVMPSDHENFGIAIAEALTAGVPVITTTGTPWRILQDLSAGWWIPANVSSLVAALDQALSEPPSERRLRAERSKDISRDFSIDLVSRSLLRVYEKCLSHL